MTAATTELAEVLASDPHGLQPRLVAWLGALGSDGLPQRLICSRGGLLDPQDWSVTVLHSQHSDRSISAALGVFFVEVVGGCNCHDEPTRFNDYCEIRLEIDRATAVWRWRSEDSQWIDGRST